MFRQIEIRVEKEVKDEEADIEIRDLQRIINERLRIQRKHVLKDIKDGHYQTLSEASEES